MIKQLRLLIVLITLSQVIGEEEKKKKDIPKEWWLNSKGITIDDKQSFEKMVDPVNGQYANTHMFIDIYMEKCQYCVAFQPDWNDLVEVIKEEYG